MMKMRDKQLAVAHYNLMLIQSYLAAHEGVTIHPCDSVEQMNFCTALGRLEDAAESLEFLLSDK